MDIRKLDGLIIRRGVEFLQARDFTAALKWSRSPWDAWITDSAEDAEKVARRVGGEVVGFNQVSGEIWEGIR
jgi:hypothetical protein